MHLASIFLTRLVHMSFPAVTDTQLVSQVLGERRTEDYPWLVGGCCC